MKKSKIIAYIFLTIVYMAFLMCAVMLFLILQEINQTGIYNGSAVGDDLKLSLVIVLPQIIIQLLILYYIKKKGIKFT